MLFLQILVSSYGDRSLSLSLCLYLALWSNHVIHQREKKTFNSSDTSIHLEWSIDALSRDEVTKWRMSSADERDSVGFENSEWIIDEKLVVHVCTQFDAAIFIDLTDDKKIVRAIKEARIAHALRGIDWPSKTVIISVGKLALSLFNCFFSRLRIHVY